MNQGKIIEYIDQGRFVCTLCIHDKGSKLHLLTAFNREVNLPPKRAILISRSSLDTHKPREEQLSLLRKTEALRKGLMGDVHVAELWELIKDEDESFDYKYLAQLSFGEMVTDDHVSALVRALFDDRVYFRMKDGRFHPNKKERIDQIIRNREEEALKEANLREGSAWLKEVLQDRAVQPPPCKDAIIDLLVDLGLHGRDARELRYGKQLFEKLGITDIEKSREILIKLGVWDDDENLDLLRLDIRRSFNENLIMESMQLNKDKMDETGFEDLSDLPVFTIDGPLTRDFDDALSLEISDDTLHLGIHIADVAGLITPDSPLDREASLRGSSLYLPRQQIPMIPPHLSQDRLSLIEDCRRAAISLLASFDKKGNLIDYRFLPSLIKVRRQLTYDQVDDLYMQEGPFKELYRLSQVLRQRRIDDDALILSLPEASFEIRSDSSIQLEMISQDTPARMIVGECMIFYNWMAARFCRDHDIPVLYRGQEEPDERLPFDQKEYTFFVFKQRRKLNPLTIGVEPRPHTGMGLDAYIQVSSPIRRYIDLVVQRQIRNFLLNIPPVYNEEELEQIRISTGPLLKDLARVKQSRIRYWIEKYLLQHLDETFPALVLDRLKTKYRILLTDFLLVGEMKREKGQNFSSGEKIMVKVRRSDPWNDTLNLKYVSPKY